LGYIKYIGEIDMATNELEDGTAQGEHRCLYLSPDVDQRYEHCPGSHGPWGIKNRRPVKVGEIAGRKIPRSWSQ
jgi:hypothetical protein